MAYCAICFDNVLTFFAEIPGMSESGFYIVLQFMRVFRVILFFQMLKHMAENSLQKGSPNLPRLLYSDWNTHTSNIKSSLIWTTCKKLAKLKRYDSTQSKCFVKTVGV